MVKITRVRFEYLESPAIGIGESQPRISWSFEGVDQSWIQKRYEIEASKPTGEVESYAVDSSSSLLVPWPGEALTSGEQVDVRVKAFGCDGAWTEWSNVARVEAGLLSPRDWKCGLIEPGDPYVPGPSHKPVIFRREFIIDKEVKNARLYITAHGVYEVLLNDESAGTEVLSPGWTSYQHRLTYHTLPVRPKEGLNTLDVHVAEGWFCGRLGYGGGKSNLYGDTIGTIALLILDFEPGDRQIIGTDETWRWTYGPIISSSIYDGECYDRNDTHSGPSSMSTRWNAVKSSSVTNSLEAPIGPPVRRVKEMIPKSIVESPTGKTIVDFGQNFVGRVRLNVPPPRERTSIRLRHAEVLEKGEIVTRTLRIAKAEDTLILTAKNSITWEPFFTFHGFRYVEIEGYESISLDSSNIQGIVLQTDMVRTGHFSCSNEQLNKLHKNVQWSMRGNFLSIPTDCPQRDERLGWTGDLNVFVNTANFLFDTFGMLSSWLKDLALEQSDANGIVPLVVPKVRDDHARDAHPIWGDAAIMVPWSIYQSTGDKDILSQQYDSMKLWLETIPRRGNNLWNYKAPWKLGDWLDPASPTDDPGNATTDPELIANIFLIHITRLMSQITRIVKGDSALDIYGEQVDQLLAAFSYEYIAPSGLLASDTQTALALAIHFDIYKDVQQERRAAERLVYIIKTRSRFKIATGFAGTPYIGHALTKAGYSNVFYRMLLERRCPSWLYPVTMGATTIWERWDSMLPDGSINPGEMTSFNHYALGAVADWMHKVILGMRAAEPGWGVWTAEPIPGGGLKWAEGSFLSGHGLCKVRWDIKDGGKGKGFALRVEVPPNTKCRVKLPREGEQAITVGSGVHEFECVYTPQEWPVRAEYPPHTTPDDDIPENHE